MDSQSQGDISVREDWLAESLKRRKTDDCAKIEIENPTPIENDGKEVLLRMFEQRLNRLSRERERLQGAHHSRGHDPKYFLDLDQFIISIAVSEGGVAKYTHLDP